MNDPAQVSVSSGTLQVPQSQPVKVNVAESLDAALPTTASLVGQVGGLSSVEMPIPESTLFVSNQAGLDASVMQSPTPPTVMSEDPVVAVEGEMNVQDNFEPITDLATVSGVTAVLVQQGAVTQDQVDGYTAQSATTGQSVEEIMLSQGVISEDQLLAAKAVYYNVELVDLNDAGVSPEAVNQLTEGVARRYHLLPFGYDRDERVLRVAMANPMDLRAIDFVEKKTGLRIVPYLSTNTIIEAKIADSYAQSLSTEVKAALKETSESGRKVVDVSQLGEVIREAPIAKIVETVLTFAMKARASDVHIEPQDSRTRIRYRIDGILHEKLVLPKGVHEAVVSRIKILAGLKIDEKRLPQDGRFSFRVAEEEVDLRVSTLPTVNGEKVVMRLLKKSDKVPTMQELGLRGLAYKHVEKSVSIPHGIILVTGPTGSGKTTTLYSMLHKLNTPRVNIVTLEDPVEYEMPGVNQVQINTKAGLTFASGLRSFLRQDPNIIMVGEIRDQETAELAVQASLTGHLVFSTLHTNSAAGALPRLLDMKVESYLLASSLSCVIGQRVARKISDASKEPYKPEPAVLQDIKNVLGPLFTAWIQQKGITEDQVVLYRGKGSAEDNNTGYSGRVGIFEVLPISERISRLVLERAPTLEIEKQALAEGMMLMKQDGYLKVLEGVTTIEEVLRVAEV